MAQGNTGTTNFNIMIVGQNGRLMYEAVLFAASLRANSPDWSGQLFVAEPQNGPLWNGDPRIPDGPVRQALIELGAQIVPFETKHFGQAYPYGNKIEGLSVLPDGEPFVFFDTDTLVTGDLTRVPFDFDVPSASTRVSGTWPKEELYWPGYAATWKSLYDKFGLDYESSLDLGQPEEYWKRHLYFNAGFFYYKCPKQFGARFLEYALAIRDDRPEELVLQELNPWLDQVALPLVIHSFGGRRDALPQGLLDGEITCHYRLLPLLYARESDAVVEVLERVSEPNKIKKILKQYDPMKRMIYQKRGHKARALFDQNDLPRREQAIRNALKREGYWMR
ncbi:hypothetical protein [Nereida sp. MMG025]|uniref:hypothetical protein n=1 Tax=Nereida sp. MMG025 TaxID=2909981 RepID=UPI001F2A1F47|nr:hypothetical protein [Nereida sp. MMG025]MCF6445179.1 hypothetical protein [Nereida sp. MMG025]